MIHTNFDFLNVRQMYLTRIFGDFKNYNYDRRAMLKGGLPKTLGLNPIINDLVSMIFDKKHSSSQEQSPDRYVYYRLFIDIKQSVAQYIEFKRAHASLQEMEKLDLWGAELTSTEDKDLASRLVIASDHVEDILWLCQLVEEKKLCDADIDWDSIVKSVLEDLPQYFDQSPVAIKLKESATEILKHANEMYLLKEYKQTMAKIHELKSLIKPN